MSTADKEEKDVAKLREKLERLTHRFNTQRICYTTILQEMRGLRVELAEAKTALSMVRSDIKGAWFWSNEEPPAEYQVIVAPVVLAYETLAGYARKAELYERICGPGPTVLRNEHMEGCATEDLDGCTCHAAWATTARMEQHQRDCNILQELLSETAYGSLAAVGVSLALEALKAGYKKG